MTPLIPTWLRLTLPVAALSFAVAMPVFAQDTPSQDDADVKFAGSDTVGLGLMPLIMEGYAEYKNALDDKIPTNSEIEAYHNFIADNGAGEKIGSFLVVSTGSGDAFDALADKSAHLGMTSRRIKDEEQTLMLEAGAGPMTTPQNERVIAVDSLAVIVNPANPVETISLRDLVKIYEGEITNWAELGGNDAPITVLSRDDGSSTRGVFEAGINSGEDLDIAERVTFPGGDNPEMSAAVAADPNAIGYVGFAYKGANRALNLTNECGITARATPFSVKTEEYPLGRRLYLYSRADNLPAEAEDFLQYVMSENADAVIASSGFVDLGIDRIKQAEVNGRLAQVINARADGPEATTKQDLLVEMLKWDRLSTTVRFETGSTALGEKARNDIRRLIDYLQDLPQGSQVAVVGFTDDEGDFGNNLSLSRSRATSVLNEIEALGADRLSNVAFETKGFSELAPTACNTDINGRSINRRVEIWVNVPRT